MPKLIAFSEPGHTGTKMASHNNDPDLMLYGDDFSIKPAFVRSGSCTIFDEVGSQATQIGLPHADGDYKKLRQLGRRYGVPSEVDHALK